MILSHKVRLRPTERQRKLFVRLAGTARFVWNWALAEWNEQYEMGGKPKADELRRYFNSIYAEKWPWMSAMTRDARAQPFAYLKVAFQKFFDGNAEHPKFKKKNRSKDSFYVANDMMSVDGMRVRLPKIGFVRMAQSLRFDGKIQRAVVSRTADRWFISITVELPDAIKARNADGIVGVDLGLKAAATFSTGESIPPPRPLGRIARRLKIISRRHVRAVPGSNNKKKITKRLARLHAKVANVRRDFWHKLTTKLVRENQAIGIEDLCVKGMAKTRLSKSIADVSIGMFKPMLEYKAKMYATRVVVADRFFPSSKLCSACGAVRDRLSLSERSWACGCGAQHDRDLNAATNLANLALRAVGPEVTPVRHEIGLKRTRGRNRSKPEGSASLL